MEKIRVFERKCIRACLSKYRSPETDYRHFISNKKLYNEANIHRIDCFILKLIRNHFSQIHKITENSLISSIIYPNPLYFENTCKTGYVPPEAFPFLDKKNLIQDSNNVPIIYHINRKNATRKKFLYDPNLNSKDPNPLWIYNMSLSNKDRKDNHRKNKSKFFWLE